MGRYGGSFGGFMLPLFCGCVFVAWLLFACCGGLL